MNEDTTFSSYTVQTIRWIGDLTGEVCAVSNFHLSRIADSVVSQSEILVTFVISELCALARYHIRVFPVHLVFQVGQFLGQRSRPRSETANFFLWGSWWIYCFDLEIVSCFSHIKQNTAGYTQRTLVAGCICFKICLFPYLR